MAILSFKNIGTRTFQTESDLLSKSLKPIGVKTPIEWGRQGEGLFKMHFNLADQLHDNLRNLILTNHGERLCLYDFGANLRPMLSERNNKDDFDQEAMIRINTAVSKYMPFISLEGFDSSIDYEDNQFINKVVMIIVYSVPDLNVIEKKLKVVMSVM